MQPGPDWLGWLLVVAFLTVAGYCVVRLVVAHRARARYLGEHRAIDLAQLVMAVGMAVMASPVGGPVPAAGWQTAFLLVAAWFLGCSWRRIRTGVRTKPIGWHGNSPHHAIGALAMLYMVTAMPTDARHMAMPWTDAHPAPGPAAVGWVLAGYFAGYAVRLGPRLLGPLQLGPGTSGAPPVPGVLHAPRTTAACEVAMALGTAYLLVPAH